MTVYWLLLAGLLVLVFSALRKRLRKQKRELSEQPTRFDEFADETRRIRRKLDRMTDLAQQPDRLNNSE